MSNDEREIRQLLSDWLAATASGDVDGVLSLMADDALFLVVGQPPMTKADFATAARAQAEGDPPRFEGAGDIKELEILGEWAFMWQELTVTTTSPNGAPPVKRSGHTLTIFRKQNGKWLLARDANLLTLVE